MATVQYDAKTGQKLATGASTTDALGNTYKQGTEYAPKNTGSGSNAKVLFDAKTGKLLDNGASTTDALGNTFKQGSTYNPAATAPIAQPQINTKQPSPTDIKIGANLPGAPSNSIDATGTALVPQVNAGSLGAMNAPASKFQQAFNNAQGEAPSDAGTAMGAVQKAVDQISPPQQDTTAIEQAMLADPFHQKLLQDQADYNNVANQGASLLKFYDQAIKQAGIPAINKELLNTKKIIDGTEKDIRDEVQAVSGFATESQVLALAGARNKQLIANYNNLLDEKKMAMENINTRMSLAEQDRNFALNVISQRMQWDQQEMAYRDKFVSNAQEGYNAVISAVGYDGLYKSLQATGDPTTISAAEKTLGLQPGQLQSIASQPNLDTQIKKAQLANIYSEINARNNAGNDTGTITGKPQTASQSAANLYADRLNQSNVTLDELGSKFATPGAYGNLLPNFLQSGDRQAYEQAKTNFVTAVLRRESGAAISPTEFSTADKQYFPQPGDKPAALEQKAILRNNVINNFYKEANVLRPVLPGQIIESGGKKYKVGLDGQTLTEIS